MRADWWFAVLTVAATALAQPTSLSESPAYVDKFESDIQVQTDGSLFVRETIVLNTRVQINDPIIREFPKRGTWPEVKVIGVILDGKSTDHNLEKEPQLLRLSLGSPGGSIDYGQHIYVISYEVAHFVTMDRLKAHLTWEVTGRNWTIPIAQCTAKFTLPDEIEHSSIQYSGATREPPPSKPDYSSEFGLPNTVTYLVQRPIGPGQGLVAHINWVTPDKSVGHLLKTKLTKDVRWMFGTAFLVLLAVIYIVGGIAAKARPATDKPSH